MRLDNVEVEGVSTRSWSIVLELLKDYEERQDAKKIGEDNSVLSFFYAF
jgi:hypothetical protein